MSITLCKWLLIGDSLLVALNRHLPESESRAIVGNTVSGALLTIQQDLEYCKPGKVIVSLGSNVLFNDINIEINKLKDLIWQVQQQGREVIILGVPARGKYFAKAHRFNSRLRSIPGTSFIDPDILTEDMIQKDDIHLTYKGNKFLSKVIQKRYDK